ncbi:MAG TPA: potassium transporter Kup [Vicinamibacterales bacterium]|jgi:KUP system potassium uptake protein|nr:potassium transporter Kup [Vicinamibacterales bacterium]
MTTTAMTHVAAPSARVVPLTLTALGVVYGDIGTSPLYTIRECFYGTHAVAVTPENVLGVLSMVLYALLIVISIKYIAIVMRADNQGEGGILALTALLPASGKAAARNATPILIGLGIFGAALLYGDGMITPAISVLGAVEGLQVETPLFAPYVVPMSVAILVVLFLFQKYGTHSVGRLFGPIMVVWFVTIAGLGISWIVREPGVIAAINPVHAVRYFQAHGIPGIAVLGAVFLAVTGGEALYADMGHFGKTPIRIAWFALVLPALMLNYFGQGALLLLNGDAARQPFFLLAPSWALFPLVGIATAAAIIASQALISGAFSLTQQAIQLGYAPRLDIEHTSSHEMGQVYVPQVNWALMISTILIVIGFGSSSALAAAYGIAVTMTMVITALLLHVIAVERWKWPRPLAFAITCVFLTIDLTFFGANLLKLFQGGWLPILIGACIFTVMTTWKTGRRVVAERLVARAIPIDHFLEAITAAPPIRVPGTAVFMTAQPRGIPPALAHNLRHNKMLHEHVVLLTVSTAPVPHVADDERLTVNSLGFGIFSVRLVYGFMEDPNVPEALHAARALGLHIDPTDITYFLGRETILVTGRRGMARWREKLFVVMTRNAVRATAFFRLPPERVVELGVQVEI